MNEANKRMSAKSETCILIPSWDGYCDLWKPFFDAFFTHWPDCPFEIYLGTTGKAFSDDRVNSLPIEQDSGFCANLDSFLSKLNQANVIIWIEDLFLIHEVSTPEVLQVVQIAEQLKAKHLRLVDSRTSVVDWIAGKNGITEYPGIGELPSGSPYRASLMVCLWDKAVLRDLLLAEESAWEFEKNASVRSNCHAEGFYAITTQVSGLSGVRIVNVIRKGVVTQLGQRILKKMGYPEVIANRGQEGVMVDFYRRVLRRWVKAIKLRVLGRI